MNQGKTYKFQLKKYCRSHIAHCWAKESSSSKQSKARGQRDWQQLEFANSKLRINPQQHLGKSFGRIRKQVKAAKTRISKHQQNLKKQRRFCIKKTEFKQLYQQSSR